MDNKFKEINISDFPQLDKSLYPDYFLEGCLPPDRLFKYKDFYVELVMEDCIPFLSIINLGKPIPIIPYTLPLLQQILSEYSVAGFQWCKKETEYYVKRILKYFKTYESFVDEHGYNNVIIYQKESD